MQVSNVQDHVTHAVIGGKETIEFGISSSAEFFHILSSTLYSDQLLAVVREVMCNAWDAHIHAERTSTPIKVTVSDTEFKVEDSGFGIPHGDIGLIYGTYGNSTKKNDGQQTGGFGLGCKAPFAYTDHFEVQSSNDGVRTIYAISKSSAQAMGKPGITPVVSLPTKETGLTVSIALLSLSDARRIESLVKKIAFDGDMHVTLNGDLLDKINFPAGKSYMLRTNTEGTYSDVTVRYGNVVYPVKEDATIKTPLSRAVKCLRKVTGRTYGSRLSLILQAPPHSITVTPSRESLSMQEHTQKTLIRLLDDFSKEFSIEFPPACTKISKTLVDEMVTKSEYASLLSTEKGFNLAGVNGKPELLTTYEGMAKYFMLRNYPDGWAFRKDDLIYRVGQMLQAGLLNRGLAQSYLRELKLTYETPSVYHFSYASKNWFKRRVIGGVLRAVRTAQSDLVPPNELYVYDMHRLVNRRGDRYDSDTNLQPLGKAALRHTSYGLPYLRNILVLTTTVVDLSSRRYAKHEVFKKYPDTSGFLVYRVSRKKGAAEAALACFTKAGYTVVDLTTRYDWDTPTKKVVKPSVPTKPKQIGYPLLSNAVRPEYSYADLKFCTDTHRTLVCAETAEFYFEIPSAARHSNFNRLPGFNISMTKEVIKRFGSQGVVTKTKVQTEKCIKAGMQRFEEWFANTITKLVESNPRIMEFQAHDPRRFNDFTGNTGRIVDVLCETPELRSKFKLVDNLTDEDKVILGIWDAITNAYQYTSPAVVALVDKMGAIPVAPVNLNLVKKIKDNPLLEILDASGIKDRVRSTKDPVQRKKVLDILISVINN